jgi:hypothetical protein
MRPLAWPRVLRERLLERRVLLPPLHSEPLTIAHPGLSLRAQMCSNIPAGNTAPRSGRREENRPVSSPGGFFVVRNQLSTVLNANMPVGSRYSGSRQAPVAAGEEI